MNKTKKEVKILIVEDDLEMQFELCEAIANELATVVSANSVSGAKTILEKHPDIEILAIDGDLKAGGDIKETSKFVREIISKHKNITGIAMSSSAQYNAMLCDAGCKLKITSSKTDLISIIESLLNKH